MRRLAWLCLLFVLFVTPSRAGDFVPGTEDVPLMPGLAAVEGSLVVFDKPEGRIVESAATGAVLRRDVTRFYVQSLPQLGWRRTGAGNDTSWQREGERLRMKFRGKDGALTVNFTLSPM